MKIPKQAYTAEFKELAVKRIKDGQSVSMVCKELGLSDQTVRNWVKAAAEGKLGGAGGRVVTPEEMELSRLRAENLRLKRENEILKKNRRRTLQGMFCDRPAFVRRARSFRRRRSGTVACGDREGRSDIDAFGQADLLGLHQAHRGVHGTADGDGVSKGGDAFDRGHALGGSCYGFGLRRPTRMR